MAYDLIAKSKVEVIVSDDQVKNVIKTITKSAGTGVHGDGIVFVMPVEDLVNILEPD